MMSFYRKEANIFYIYFQIIKKYKGGSPRASIKMGEKDNEGAEEIMGNCFISLIIMSVILTIFHIYNFIK